MAERKGEDDSFAFFPFFAFMSFRLFLILSVQCLAFFAHGQLTVTVSTENPGSQIRDGVAVAEVSGGVEPYSYHWSKKDTPLSSAQCVGLDEGYPFKLIVTDASGEKVEIQDEIPAESTAENLNAFFIPVVDALGIVLFWDPFAASGIYDPLVLDDQGNPVYHPNGDPVTQDVWLVVVLLIAGALYFTFYMGFVNIRGFRHAIDLTLGRYRRPDDPGEVTQFQALTAALSGTLGLGNISLVAVAIAVGGPGATLWMIVAGLIGMSSKFVECTLGVKYRVIDSKGEVSGGPMHYLSRGLAGKGMGTFGKTLAILFAIMCIGGSLGGGNMIQANQAFAQIRTTIPSMAEHSLWFGVAIALCVGMVIMGGIRSIAKVTEKMIPAAVVVYTVFSLIIIGIHIRDIDEAMLAIWNGAFSPDAMKGGVIGVMMMGFRRASFSNEAGIGSASIAHSTSRTERPVSEGMVSLLEPFIDTVIVCTMTALVLVFTGYASDPGNLTGSELTSAAFTSIFPWFDWVLLVCIIIFAYATMISWSYYGMKSWAYLFGEKPWIKQSFNVIFMVCTVIGTVSSLGAVVDFSDMMILGMAFPNIIGLLLLSPEVRKDMKIYFSDLRSGKIVKWDKTDKSA